MAVAKPSCVPGLGGHEDTRAPPSTAPDGPSSMASSMSAALKQPASMFSFLHIKSFREVGRGGAIGAVGKRL